MPICTHFLRGICSKTKSQKQIRQKERLILINSISSSTVHEICITGKLIIFCITLAMHGPNTCEYVIHHAIDAWILLYKCE